MNSLHRGSCYKIFTCGGEFSLLHPRVLSCNQFLFSLQFIHEYDQSLAPIHLNSTCFCSRRHSNYYSTASSHHLTPEKSFPGKQVSFFIFYVLIINWLFWEHLSHVVSNTGGKQYKSKTSLHFRQFNLQIESNLMKRGNTSQL